MSFLGTSVEGSESEVNAGLLGMKYGHENSSTLRWGVCWICPIVSFRKISAAAKTIQHNQQRPLSSSQTLLTDYCQAIILTATRVSLDNSQLVWMEAA